METWEAIDQEIIKLKASLALEKKEDYDRYQSELAKANQKQKVEKGVSWHPCQLSKKGFTLGNRAFIVIHRSKSNEGPHRLRAGGPVDVFLSGKANEPKNRNAVNGVIHFVNRNKMKVILNMEEFPFWIDDGDISVELQFDERTYREMDKALNTLAKASTGRLKELKGVCFGKIPPAFGSSPEFSVEELNESQEAAVKHILSAKDVALVHGPPGTGKTTTLVKAIAELAKIEKQVLVCASSNAAVDLLSERCSNAGLNVVRIGNISRVDESILSITLESRLAEHPENKNIKKVRQQAEEIRRKTRKFKKWNQREARQDNIAALKEARDLESWARQLEDRLLEEVLFQADVIACTFVNATHSSLRKIEFNTVVIDEAGQALEPATWIPIINANKVVLAGDPFQLPPTVKSSEAKKAGLEVTLLERLIKRFDQQAFLNTQYRMHSDIMNFSNRQFYNNDLKAADLVANWKLSNYAGKSVVYIDTAGCGFDEKTNEKSLSRYNDGEFFILQEHFLEFSKTQAIESMPSIGIISPYREQVIFMEEKIGEEEAFTPFLDNLTIKTIDGFQGQERDVIYISLVRSNPTAEIGFLKDYRRMNVAMTRAKKLLIVIGDSATIGADKFYLDFLNYVEENGEYRTGWEFMS